MTKLRHEHRTGLARVIGGKDRSREQVGSGDCRSVEGAARLGTAVGDLDVEFHAIDRIRAAHVDLNLLVRRVWKKHMVARVDRRLEQGPIFERLHWFGRRCDVHRGRERSRKERGVAACRSRDQLQTGEEVGLVAASDQFVGNEHDRVTVVVVDIVDRGAVEKVMGVVAGAQFI